MTIIALMAFFTIPVLLGWEALVSWIDKDGIYEKTSDSD